MKWFLISLAITVATGCGRKPLPSDDLAPPRVPIPPASALEVGDPFPALRVEGWVYGQPPTPGATGVKLVVVDVWAQWCPFCRETAPGLVRVFKKYSGRGVAFVSATNMNEAAVKSFIDQFSISWPNGYGLATETVTALGASSGQALEGQAIAPVVYLVGPDRKVRWSDNQSRFRHGKPKDWERELDAAIETALAEKP